MDISASQVFSYLFERNQRLLQLIYTRIAPVMMQPLENFTLNHRYRLELLGRSGLSILLATRLVEGLQNNRLKLELAKRILSHMHKLPKMSPPPTCIATIQAYTDRVTSVAFHPTLPLLVSGSFNRTIKLWDCTNPINPTQIANLTGHTNWINSVAFHPTLPLLAFGSWDETVKLWDCTNSRNPTQIAELKGHTDIVWSIAFHPTLPLLASGSKDKTVKLWDCTNPRNPTQIAELKGHTNIVWSIAFHPTLPLLATGSGDKTAKLWKL